MFKRKIEIIKGYLEALKWGFFRSLDDIVFWIVIVMQSIILLFMICLIIQHTLSLITFLQN